MTKRASLSEEALITSTPVVHYPLTDLSTRDRNPQRRFHIRPVSVAAGPDTGARDEHHGGLQLPLSTHRSGSKRPERSGVTGHPSGVHDSHHALCMLAMCRLMSMRPAPLSPTVTADSIAVLQL